MKLWPLILLALAGCASAYPPDFAAVKRTTVRIEMPSGVCSGTAVGHFKILTAEHCTTDGITGWVINGRTVVITKVITDGHDHALLTTDVYFQHIARFGPKPKQGDLVFTHGNPNGLSDILLIGHVAGWMDGLMMLDRHDWFGCSGAAVFDRYGRIVGVVNAMYAVQNKVWRLTAVFPITFKPSDYA